MPACLQLDVLLAIFAYLQPPDRGRCAQVCTAWRNAIYSTSLWKQIYPIQWARGIWRWKNMQLGVQLEDLAWRTQLECGENKRKWDEDADIDESEEEYDPIAENEIALLNGLIQGLLPKVGSGVQNIVVDAGRSITSRLMHQMFVLCPNIKLLSAAYTKLDYYAFKGLNLYKCLKELQFLDLQGCEHVDDNCLKHLALCYNDNDLDKYSLNFVNNRQADIEEICCFSYPDHQKSANNENDSNCVLSPKEADKLLKTLNLSGCYKITDNGLAHLVRSGMVRSITHLDVSGCFKLTRIGLDAIVYLNSSLKPENISYCDEILDGPYVMSANGCSNLCHPMRACCRKGL